MIHIEHWATRFFLVMLFSSVEYSFYNVFLYVENYHAYYLMAGLIDTSIVLLIPFFGNTQLTRDLQKINFLSVAMHFFGWIIWMSGFQSSIYDATIQVLTWVQWARLICIWRGDADAMDNPWRNLVYSINRYMSKRDYAKEIG